LLWLYDGATVRSIAESASPTSPKLFLGNLLTLSGGAGALTLMDFDTAQRIQVMEPGRSGPGLDVDLRSDVALAITTKVTAVGTPDGSAIAILPAFYPFY
jgi:hypothetical protein